jgi:hypothetical protein
LLGRLTFHNVHNTDQLLAVLAIEINVGKCKSYHAVILLPIGYIVTHMLADAILKVMLQRDLEQLLGTLPNYFYEQYTH